MHTVSPILISFLFISSSLCSVAFDTITPPTFIGSIFATGVNAPVLPTWISMFLIIENPLSPENLLAIALVGSVEILTTVFFI